VSYDQTFKGSFTFADAHCLEAGLDQFCAGDLRRSIVDIHSLAIDGLTVTVDEDTSAPASMFDETMSALRRLGADAMSGSIKATFTMDGTDRETVRSGGRRNANGLPERHHRWDIFFAAKAGNAAALREFAGRGISLAQTFEHYYGLSPLHLAAQAGIREAVEVLLAVGIDPNVAAPSGRTPLSHAAHAEIAKLLLGAGADKDLPVGDSVALAFAFEDERNDVVEVLLDAGAAIPEPARKGIVEACVRAGNLGILRRLLQIEPGLKATLRDPELMDLAVSSGEVVLVDFLLDAGATLPESFLRDAIRSNSIALADHALQLQGALEACGPSSNSDDAMCIAAGECNLAMMQRLADFGVPVHPTEPGDTTPLHEITNSRGEAARECAAWLLDRGVPIDATDAHGHTPLYRVADYYGHDLALFFLERGANPEVLDGLGEHERAALRKALGDRWATLVDGEKKPTAKKKAAKKKPAAKKKVGAEKASAKKKPAAKKKAAVKKPAAKKKAAKKKAARKR
jgi:ankyrin repeat protein